MTADLMPLRERLALLRSADPPVEGEHPDVAVARRMTVVAAILYEALQRRGLDAMLVGGGVIQFHLPGAYTTGDIDMPIATQAGLPAPADDVAAVFRDLGFERGSARHWTLGEGPDAILVEVPGHELDAPSDLVTLGAGLHLRIAKKEFVLIGRIAEFHNTGNAAHALQAILMLRLLRSSLDRPLLDDLIAAERLRPAFEALRGLADGAERVTAAEVRVAWERLRAYSSRAPGDDAGRTAGDR